LFCDRAAQVRVIVDDEEGLALSHAVEHAPYRPSGAKTFQEQA
jgi:hypothetical protein